MILNKEVHETLGIVIPLLFGSYLETYNNPETYDRIQELEKRVKCLEDRLNLVNKRTVIIDDFTSYAVIND